MALSCPRQVLSVFYIYALSLKVDTLTLRQCGGSSATAFLYLLAVRNVQCMYLMYISVFAGCLLYWLNLRLSISVTVSLPQHIHTHISTTNLSCYQSCHLSISLLVSVLCVRSYLCVCVCSLYCNAYKRKYHNFFKKKKKLRGQMGRQPIWQCTLSPY